MVKMLDSSELVLAPDGSLYHIRLFPEQVADNIILVGDPGRVKIISSFFDSIESSSHNREIASVTGNYKGKRLTAISTGMGTDNIDIVITELDAAVNINLQQKEYKDHHQKLNLIRIGTCGALQSNIKAGESIISQNAIGIDGLLYFYKNYANAINSQMTDEFIDKLNWPHILPRPYAVECSTTLLNRFDLPYHKGITITAPGFYGPQGREIRLEPLLENGNTNYANFTFNNKKILNLEMETSALYGLSKMLGHEAITICLVIANRSNGSFLNDYKLQMNEMILQILEKV